MLVLIFVLHITVKIASLVGLVKNVIALFTENSRSVGGLDHINQE